MVCALFFYRLLGDGVARAEEDGGGDALGRERAAEEQVAGARRVRASSARCQGESGGAPVGSVRGRHGGRECVRRASAARATCQSTGVHGRRRGAGLVSVEAMGYLRLGVLARVGRGVGGEETADKSHDGRVFERDAARALSSVRTAAPAPHTPQIIQTTSTPRFYLPNSSSTEKQCRVIGALNPASSLRLLCSDRRGGPRRDAYYTASAFPSARLSRPTGASSDRHRVRVRARTYARAAGQPKVHADRPAVRERASAVHVLPRKQPRAV